MTANDPAPRCANCGEVAGPRFCPHCGQELATHRGPLLAVGRELLSDWVSLDSRLLRSLGALLRPGRLSELYLGGRRAPFLRPFRLYLLASLVLFSTLLTLEAPSGTDLEITIGGQRMGPAVTGNVKRTLVLWDKDTWLGRRLLAIAGDRVERLRALPREELLDVLFSGLRRSLPLTLILFVPFLALGLKLLYARGRARHALYLDHLVFALHFQSALFFALAATWLLSHLVGLPFVWSAFAHAGAALAMLIVYLPLALRHFYGQSRLRTALKTLALLFVYSQLLGLAIESSALVAIWRV